MNEAAAGPRPFGRRQRLLEAADFSAVFSARRSLRGDTFDLLYKRNGDTGPRLGLVVAKKFARRAVMRNLLKRLARESFRAAAPGLPSMDLVLRLRKVVAGPVNREGRRLFRTEVDGLLARLPH